MATIGTISPIDAAGGASDILEERLPRIPSSRLDVTGIRRRTQEFAAPGIRKLRQALRSSLARTSDNPTLAALMKRRALEGFGTGLEGIVGEARRGATSVGVAELREESANERLAFSSEFQRRLAILRQSNIEKDKLALRRPGDRSNVPSRIGYFTNEAIRARNFGLPAATPRTVSRPERQQSLLNRLSL